MYMISSAPDYSDKAQKSQLSTTLNRTAPFLN